MPSKEKPAINFTMVAPYQAEKVEGYHVLPLPVNHSVPTVGYQITSPDGGTVFYTGDTGPSLTNCWEHISPQLLITEVSAPNRFQELYQKRGHLTPRLLKQELISFQKLKGYLPQVVIVHINPGLEKEIETELTEIAQGLETLLHLRIVDNGLFGGEPPRWKVDRSHKLEEPGAELVLGVV